MISTGQTAAAALWVTGEEGPYHCDPHDPGGETAWGFALRYHPELAGKLKTLQQATAAQMLAEQYWPKGAEGLPSYLAIPILAFSVLEGPGQAAQCLQRALGIYVDGDIGAETIAAAEKPLPKALLVSFYRECMRRLHTRPTWVLEGLGWECRQMAASLAALG